MGMKHVETGTYTPTLVLVTGFGAFPGARSNPTAAILTRIDRQRARLGRLGITLRTVLLPVVYADLEPALGRAVALGHPHAIVHLGLASRRRVVSVETRARNRANPFHPDAVRRRAAQTLVAQGPGALRSTFPAARLVPAIRKVWRATAASIDAGDYVCNAALYRSLACGLSPCTGFLHVPRLCNPVQPCRRTRRPRPTLDHLTRAVCAAILVCAQAARPHRAIKAETSQ